MRAKKRDPKSIAHPDWKTLLVDAVTTPGRISEAYRRFWNYSIGNQLLALCQCYERGLAPGPIHTFKGWLEVGRHIKKGEKAIVLCMPLLVKQKGSRRPFTSEVSDHAQDKKALAREGAAPIEASTHVTVFTYKRRWFVLSQTEGADYVPTELPQWSEAKSLQVLEVNRMRFDHPNGNCQGFATGRNVAVSPVAALPHKTLFHELAHVVLGHTDDCGVLEDKDLIERHLREVEAECVALICCESLELPGAPECRGYIQHWLGDDPLTDRSAARIFKAAHAILHGGYIDRHVSSEDHRSR